MDEHDCLADRFEANRRHLRAVAYRMLGSMSEADDAVQESWLRLSRAGAGDVRDLRAWLTTVVSRVCLDMLRSRSSRREDLVGAHLPDPIVRPADGADPEYEAVLADSVGLALLVVLESLAPAERLAFVLHDMFAVPFGDIGRIVDRSPTAARQLASRARRRVRGASAVPDVDLARQRELVDAFLAASRAGDFEALVAVLAPDAVLRVDAGPALAGESGEVHGAEEVARLNLGYGPRLARFARPVVVNGVAGFLVVPRNRPVALAAFTVLGDRIAAIDIIADPARLRELDLPEISD